MKVKTRRLGDIHVLDLQGNLEGGPDNLRLLGIVSGHAHKGELELILNFQKVPLISSTGLGILMRLRNLFLEQGGMLRLCALNERNLKLMSVTQTRSCFEVYPTEAEALEAAHSTA